MEYNNILLETSERIATLTFNRPDVMNALDARTMDELSDAVRRVKSDPAAKVLILTGAGEKAFVAGADIQMLAGQTPESARELSRSGQRVLRDLETLGKPSIAAVNGFALGGGCEVAMACSIRYAAENARFGQPEINLGIIPGYGGTQRLVRLVGLGRALEINLTGDMISAEEACRVGLVNKVVPADRLMDEVRSLAAKLASKSGPAVELILRASNAAGGGSLDDGLALEADLFGRVIAFADAKEGLAAFLEKREARFQDR
ncbi:MAG: enoyl-CoA hydratase-related protein [bacterium]